MTKLLKISSFINFYNIKLSHAIFARKIFLTRQKNLFENGKIEESKFLFQRNIVFNPKDSKSYLYLAKIYETEENEKEEEKNINTVHFIRTR